MSLAYYNEYDPKAATWLRELIKAGHIAPGIVDTRIIEDVTIKDLSGFTQCHFFAGIGVWSYALRLAGWPDDRPVWTGSCPCQPFSAAGKGGGFTDERHLWPAWFQLIAQSRPVDILGEQVASKDGLAWLDLVSSDLEAADYAVGAVDLCAAGVGAPHIRQRLFFVAQRLADARSARLSQRIGVRGVQLGAVGAHPWEAVERSGHAGGVADTKREQRVRGWASQAGVQPGEVKRAERFCDANEMREHTPTGPTNGLWGAADWLRCRDDKWRPVEPGTFPLVDGAAARVGRLRGYGNAINAEAARAFIEAYMRA